LCQRKPTTTGQRPVACSLRWVGYRKTENYQFSGTATMLLVSDPAFSIQTPPVNTQEIEKLFYFCAESNAFMHWWKKQI